MIHSRMIRRHHRSRARLRLAPYQITGEGRLAHMTAAQIPRLAGAAAPA